MSFLLLFFVYNSIIAETRPPWDFFSRYVPSGSTSGNRAIHLTLCADNFVLAAPALTLEAGNAIILTSFFGGIVPLNGKRGEEMATAIKAIPTLKGREAREFLRHAEEVERKYATMSERDEHPLCKMAHAILVKSGMLK